MREQFATLTDKFTGTLQGAIDQDALAKVADRLETANERVLDLVVDTNRRVVEAAVATADRVVETLPIELPFADRLPTAAENGQHYLDFVDRAVALNRDFNQRVVTLIKSDVPAVADAVAAQPQPAVKRTAKKATAKKTTAKKPAAKKPATKPIARKRAVAKTSAPS